MPSDFSGGIFFVLTSLYVRENPTIGILVTLTLPKIKTAHRGFLSLTVKKSQSMLTEPIMIAQRINFR